MAKTKIKNNKAKSISKQISLNEYTSKTFGVLAILSTITLLILLAVGLAYSFTNIYALLIALFVLIPVLILALLFASYFSFRKLYRLFYLTLFETTMLNYTDIKNQKVELRKYEQSNIKDFKMLNDQVDSINKSFSLLSLSTSKVDYSNIELDYVNKASKTITEASFKKNLRDIIFVAQRYRNAIIKVAYPEVELEKESLSILITAIHKTFKDNGLLIALNKTNDGVWIFTPNIDSISNLNEQLENVLKLGTISNKTIAGISLISPRINCVIYPFTSIEDITSDILYSESQNKEINIYIPHRYNGLSNELILQNSMDQNNISKVLSYVNELSAHVEDFNIEIKKAESILKEYASYLSIEEGGIIFFDKEKKALITRASFRLKDKGKPILEKGEEFKKEWSDLLEEIKDTDSSYLFSTRSNANNEFGRYMDILGVNSGWFFSITEINNKCIGIIYLINKAKYKFNFNSYIKESMLVMSTTLGYYLKVGNIYASVQQMQVRENNLMKMANISSYTIDKTTHEVVGFTPSFKEEVPGVEIGKICYETFFGANEPCQNCPLVTKNKIIRSFRKGRSAEISYSINTKMSNYIELVCRNLSTQDESRNKFDADYLVNSYYSFNERLKNLYLSQSKGYVLLLEIDNIRDLIKTYGNEGFAFYIRCFSSDLISQIPEIKDVFLYKDDTFALIFPESGKLDIINVLEKVYNFTKIDYLNDGNTLRLKVGYETVKYPQEFTTPSDLIRHLENTLSTRNYKIFTSDTIHIEENDFYRPASRKEYILSIIKHAAENNKFIIKCQPVIKGNDKSIVGGEILIRLSDDYNNTMLNTEELIKVAGENNKLNTISDLLIDYVGNLFKQFGFSIFKTYSFKRMSINADYSYFTQENFMEKIIGVVEKYHFPKNFLTFEIGEQDLFNNYESFKDIVDELKKNDIDIVCDQYTGQYLSLDKLTKIHIKEIKTNRNFVIDMDVQTEKLNNVKKLLDFAKEQNVLVTLVGVENGQQYKLINNYSKDVAMQGYYFYHSLDVNELIEAIRKTNSN